MPRVPVVAVARRAPGLLQRALSPSANTGALFEGLGSLRRYQRLIIEMAREELTGRYHGQWLGAAWVLIHPLALTFLYLFLFGVVFAQRVGGTREMPLDYTAYLLAGLIPWLAFQTSMTSAVNAITANRGLVKQFTFPLEVLPAREVLAALVTWVVGVTATLLYVMLSQRVVMATWVLLPVVLAVQLLAMTGAAFLLSASAVFFRDLKDFVALFALVAMFLMPIFYLPGWVPEAFVPLLWINPFTYMIWMYQDVIYFGRFEHPFAWVVFPLAALVLFAWGVRVFRATKPMFSSTL